MNEQSHVEKNNGVHEQDDIKELHKNLIVTGD